jgi:hypothetical protein
MDITRIRTKADYDEAYRLSVQDPEGRLLGRASRDLHLAKEVGQGAGMGFQGPK